jgi:hypothetical protein
MISVELVQYEYLSERASGGGAQGAAVSLPPRPPPATMPRAAARAPEAASAQTRDHLSPPNPAIFDLAFNSPITGPYHTPLG